MKTVVLGLSGGVDSSVSALLLKNLGYNVVGVYMQNWDCNKNDQNDAMDICNKLNIPFRKVSFEADYIERVFIPFLKNLITGSVSCTWDKSK